MAKINRSVWVPTDAWAEVKHRFYYDLEDGDWDPARLEPARVNGQGEGDVSDLKDAVLDCVSDEFSNLYASDLQSVEVEFKWGYRDLDVCEWCDQPACDSDPDTCPEYSEEEHSEDEPQPEMVYVLMDQDTPEDAPIVESAI